MDYYRSVRLIYSIMVRLMIIIDQQDNEIQVVYIFDINLLFITFCFIVI
jgi:hypothetical protein